MKGGKISICVISTREIVRKGKMRDSYNEKQRFTKDLVARQTVVKKLKQLEGVASLIAEVKKET